MVAPARPARPWPHHTGYRAYRSSRNVPGAAEWLLFGTTFSGLQLTGVAVTVAGATISELAALTVAEAETRFGELPLDERDSQIARDILPDEEGEGR